MPEEAIQHADAVCIGEAEGNVPRMMEDLAAGALKQFYCSEPVDLAGLPRPNPALIRKKSYAPVDVLQATRGCNYQCSFCSVSAFHHHHFRTRPVAEVIDELKSLGRYVLFMDDNIIGDREYAAQLFAEMIPLGKRWFSQCSMGIADDEELLRLASRSGCQGLFVGFESLSEAGLRSWKKKTKLTPFPGTPLFGELDRQGRIVDKDWAHYDFNNVVFEPLHMSRETLDKGTVWVLRQFHTRSAVARRVWKSLQYLPPAVVLSGVLPLNLGWRQKLSADGNFQRGTAFAAEASKTLPP
jgi:hypothetical protein